jgi:hypothetical protein
MTRKKITMRHMDRRLTDQLLSLITPELFGEMKTHPSGWLPDGISQQMSVQLRNESKI